MTDDHVITVITDLDRAAAETIWAYHQMGHQLRQCDAAIGLGSHDLGVATYTAQLYHTGLAPVIVFSGANNPTMAERFPRGEAQHFRERAIELGVPDAAILLESRATNTGQNITYSREVLHQAGITVDSVLLVCMPYMQRRAYATCAKAWPEVQAVCASEPLAFDAYIKAIGDERHVIDQLVGDLQRVIEYPALGFATEEHVPDHVQGAYHHLCQRGYTSRLL